ncbi:MAG: transporter substrate-binding domain-containing protein [Cyanobacteria bacterium RM1_2_2]|nr:transporter substrate-binding domain-containing protein [Cyanobacteria bacterium RM1_2_2]
MKRFQFRFAILVGLVLSLLVACNPGREIADNVIDNNSGNVAKTLVMFTSADYPPYEFIETVDGRSEVKGFDIDLAEHITEKLGYGLQIDTINFDRLIPVLQSGQADFVMAGMVPTETRRQNVDFTQLYHVPNHAVLSQRGSGLSTLENLRGKIVGVRQGSIQAQRVREIPNIKIKSLQQMSDLVQALKAGRINAALVAESAAAGYLAVNPDLEIHQIPSIPGNSGAAIAFTKGSRLVQAFDQVISEMKTTGELDQLALKWFDAVSESPPEALKP